MFVFGQINNFFVELKEVATSMENVKYLINAFLIMLALTALFDWIIFPLIRLLG